MQKIKRILALIGVIVLAVLYIVTLLSAIFATEAASGFFKVSLLATFIVPLLIYVYMLVYHLIFGKKSDDDEDLLS